MYLKINIHNLQNLEFIQFIKSFLEIIGKAKPELLKVKAQYDALLSVFNAMHGFYKPELANKLTKLVQGLDSQRDQALSGIIDIIQAYEKHYDPVTQSMAETLLKSINVYGDNIDRFNYQKETATIDLICTNWKNNDEHVNALASLHFTEWANKLDELNKQFETQHMERLELDANSPEIKMADYRKQCTEGYRVILKHFEYNAFLNGEEPYIEVNKKINQLIEMNQQLLISRSNKKDEVPEEPTSVD
jgi:hypothetical protein